MLHKALFSKYSSSQNYFYSKEINNLVLSRHSHTTIKVKDWDVLNYFFIYLILYILTVI